MLWSSWNYPTHYPSTSSMCANIQHILSVTVCQAEIQPLSRTTTSTWRLYVNHLVHTQIISSRHFVIPLWSVRSQVDLMHFTVSLQPLIAYSDHNPILYSESRRKMWNCLQGARLSIHSPRSKCHRPILGNIHDRNSFAEVLNKGHTNWEVQIVLPIGSCTSEQALHWVWFPVRWNNYRFWKTW